MRGTSHLAHCRCRIDVVRARRARALGVQCPRTGAPQGHKRQPRPERPRCAPGPAAADPHVLSCQNFVRDDRTTIDFTQSEQPGGLSSEQPGQETVETDDYRAHEAASAGKIQASLRETARANRDTDGAPPCTRHALGSPPGRGRLSRHRVRGARPTAVGDPRRYITRESAEPASTRDAPASHSRRRAPSCPWRRFERARLTLAMAHAGDGVPPQPLAGHLSRTAGGGSRRASLDATPAGRAAVMCEHGWVQLVP